MVRIFLRLLLILLCASAYGQSWIETSPVNWNGTPPDAYPVQGIDVSRYQERPNWDSVRSSGAQFAFIKATEGSDIVDSSFAYNWQNARAAGVFRGAYHFYYFCSSPESQANWFIQNVPKEPGSLPPVLDLELNPYSPTCPGKPSKDSVYSAVARFMERIEAHYGQRPIIYTTLSFYREYGLNRFADEEYWLRSTAQVPATAYPGQNWGFWQYSMTTRINGIRGNTDANVFNGSQALWDEWYKRRSIR